MLKVVHVSPRVQAPGGIETLHALHREWPLEQVFVALFDRQPQPRADYRALGVTWRTPLGVMRRRFAAALREHPNALVVYHNGWGLPYFHGLDRSARRVVFLHADPAYHAPDFPGFRGLVDGTIGVTPALAQAWATELPELSGSRAALVRAPFERPDFAAAPRARSERRTIGFAGRIERAQKRLDRLPELLRELDRAGVDVRVEVLGDGALRRSLERELGSRVRFHGWVKKTDYWRTLAGWDGIVFLTEHEGGPIALFEGMAAGAIPFYPRIGGSWGDVYAPQVHEACTYPPGDLRALAFNLGQLLRRPESDLAPLRARAQALVAAHSRRDYDDVCLELLRNVGTLPRISHTRPRRMQWTDALPLGVVTRFFPAALRR